MPETEEEIQALVERHMQKGYRGMKLGWGALGQSFEKDLQLVKWARKALGDDKYLMIDVGMMWKDVKGAIKTAKAMEEYGVYWIEEPFSPDDLDAYRRLADSTHIHIAGGEEVGTVYEYQELLDKRCVDILQPDLSRCGGITVARKLTDLCDMRRVQVIPHAFKTHLLMAATLQYIASLPDAWYLEFCEQDTILRRELTTTMFQVDQDGFVQIPQAPGFGIELDGTPWSATGSRKERRSSLCANRSHGPFPGPTASCPPPSSRRPCGPGPGGGAGRHPVPDRSLRPGGLRLHQ